MRVDGADLDAAAVQGEAGLLVDDLVLEAEVLEYGGHHHGAGPRSAVLDLDGDTAAVGETYGVHALRARLAEQAGDRAHQGGLVAPTPAGVLGVRAEGVRDPALQRPRRGRGEQAERPSQSGEADRQEWSAAAVDGDVGDLLAGGVLDRGPD